MAYTPEQLRRKALQASAPKQPKAPSAINPKLRVFADAILEGATPSDASRAAGYHPSNTNALNDDTVKEILATARAGIEDLTTIKRLDVLNWFIEAIDMARTMADPCNMINGADKVAKMMGYYAPETKRLELSMDHAVLSNKLRALTDAELMDLASKTPSKNLRLIEAEVVE